MAVTSIVRDRGRAFGVAIALAMSAALVAAPVTFGAADGDPIATSTFKPKFSKAFKKQLKRNGVKMKRKGFKISPTLNSDVDPITGQADLRLGKIVFKLNRKGLKKCKAKADSRKQARKCKRKVVYNNLKGTLPGKVTSSQSGKLFRLTAAKTVTRQGFGAALSGMKIKFLKRAAKRINRTLKLNSLHKGSAGRMNLSYQPESVKIIGGTAQTTGAVSFTPPLPVGVKFLAGHCVSGVGEGITPIAPAEKSVDGLEVTFKFPVVDGEISPDGTQGLSETAGGLRIKKSESAADCATSPYGELTQEGITTNITERTVSSEVNILAAPPGVGTGPRGRAVGQTVDPTNTVTTIDPANRTFTRSGSIIHLAEVSAITLNNVFPCVANGATGPGLHSCDPSAANTAIFFGGDLFGTSNLTVVTR